MGKFDGVLLASDFDNTLLYTEEALRRGSELPPLPRRNREALEYFMAEGGRFALSTGRALAAIQALVDEIPMNAPGVICNGAAIYDFARREYVEAAMLDEEARSRGQQLLDEFPDIACEAYHIDNVIHAVQANDITRQHEHLTRVAVTLAPSLLAVPLPIGKLLFEGEHDRLEALSARMGQLGWAGDYERIFSSPYLLEVTARGANKGGMLLRLAARLGIRREHLYCVGDEANDLPMLAVSALPFAPANCIPAVRDSGATLVCHAKDGALAEVVEILDRRYGKN